VDCIHGPTGIFVAVSVGYTEGKVSQQCWI
jgi:hypothetical protein